MSGGVVDVLPLCGDGDLIMRQGKQCREIPVVLEKN